MLGQGCGRVKYTFWDLLILTQKIYYSAGSVKKISWLYQISVSISMNSVIRSYQLDQIESTIKFNEWKLLRRVWPGCGCVKKYIFKSTYSNTKYLLQCRKQTITKYFEAQSDTLTSNFGVRPLAICMLIFKTSFWVKMELGRGRGRVKYTFWDSLILTQKI